MRARGTRDRAALAVLLLASLPIAAATADVEVTGLGRDGLDRLVWGITGRKPELRAAA